jgi:hypothetical protein
MASVVIPGLIGGIVLLAWGLKTLPATIAHASGEQVA